MRRTIISFYELSPVWQSEAIRNLDDQATNQRYIKPLSDEYPAKHILWDFSQVMFIRKLGNLLVAGEAISNNSSVTYYIDEDSQECLMKFR